MLTVLYSGTECYELYVGRGGEEGIGVSRFFPVNTGVRQGCVIAPSIFNTCMDMILSSHRGTSIDNTRVTNYAFACDAVILPE